jgi:exopolyphosphatase/guanosine-5'-triphosphate,3'-diphosphate pyrophosphatase
MKNNRIAILDLGTNTFHLLIAVIHADRFEIIFREKFTVKLGEGGINRRVITSEAWERGLQAIKKIKKIIQSYRAEAVRSIATSAIRNAGNGPLFLKAIHSVTGLDISTIDGDQEAEYIYYGVRQAIRIGEEPVVIMDIGGGSVEFIIGNQQGILWKRSFEIGAQRLYDLFHQHDPVSSEDLLRLNNYLDLSLHPLMIALNNYKPVSLVGCSGTFDTVSSIYCRKHNIHVDKESQSITIDLNAFIAIHNEIISKNKAGRLAIPGMSPMRADMIGMSSALIHFIISGYSFRQLNTSRYSLKEGILSEIMDHAKIIELSA